MDRLGTFHPSATHDRAAQAYGQAVRSEPEEDEPGKPKLSAAKEKKPAEVAKPDDHSGKWRHLQCDESRAHADIRCSQGISVPLGQLSKIFEAQHGHVF